MGAASKGRHGFGRAAPPEALLLAPLLPADLRTPDDPRRGSDRAVVRPCGLSIDILLRTDTYRRYLVQESVSTSPLRSKMANRTVLLAVSLFLNVAGFTIILPVIRFW